MKVTLPWPPSALHPNSRLHWAQVAKSKKAYRYACHMLTHEAGIKLESDARPTVALEFIPPDRRHRDLDGMLSAMKSGLDGVADAIGCDDSRWKLTLSVAPGGQIGGMVKVHIITEAA